MSDSPIGNSNLINRSRNQSLSIERILRGPKTWHRVGLSIALLCLSFWVFNNLYLALFKVPDAFIGLKAEFFVETAIASLALVLSLTWLWYLSRVRADLVCSITDSSPASGRLKQLFALVRWQPWTGLIATFIFGWCLALSGFSRYKAELLETHVFPGTYRLFHLLFTFGLLVSFSMVVLVVVARYYYDIFDRIVTEREGC